MTEKRCTDCKHTKGIGYDFWCGEGHSEYEVFGAETNCPYYEYHDWSKGTPMTEKQFIQKEESIINTQTDELVNASGEESAEIITGWLNDLYNKYAEVRKENYGNLDGINYYQEENASQRERISDLECGNEQLKQEYQKLKHRHSLLHDECLDIECERDSLKKDVESLEKENEQLKDHIKKLEAQLLYTDSVCDICANHSLVQKEDYYISKCEKGHEECSKIDLNYCEDFELVEDFE